MKFQALSFLYEQKEAVAATVVLAVLFFIFWNKKNVQENTDVNDGTKRTWYGVSQIDIISGRVGALLLLFVFVIYVLLFRS